MACREELAGICVAGKQLDGDCKADCSDVLPDDQKLVIEIARVVRVGFLQQNAFHKDDTFVPMEKQLKMMQVILHLYHKCQMLWHDRCPCPRLLNWDCLIK